MKIKNVETIITGINANVKVFDSTTNVVSDIDVEINASFKTAEGLEKILRTEVKRLFPDLDMIKINSFAKVKRTYAVDINTFLAMATLTEVTEI